MHRLACPCVLGMLLFAAAVSAPSQSLVEIAREEQERREKLDAEGVPSYTDVDLASSEGPLTQVTGSTTIDAGSESVAVDEAGAPSTEPAQDESYWRDRLSAIDQRIRDFEEQLQSPLYTSNPRGYIARQRLEGQLADARAEREALVAEARRAGVPPGWLR